MRLEPECPQCADPVSGTGRTRVCPTHGETVPLWRAPEATYDAFAEHLVHSPPLPSWMPWPLPPGWQVTDFGWVGTEPGESRAAFLTCAGPTEADGVVEVTILSEEPGVGLGSRCAGVTHTDPGQEISGDVAPVRIRVDDAAVPLWAVSTADTGGMLDRSVLVGEALGRWLWLVLRPASAALSLAELPPIQDVTDLGPELVTVPFGRTPRAW